MATKPQKKASLKYTKASQPERRSEEVSSSVPRARTQPVPQTSQELAEEEERRIQELEKARGADIFQRPSTIKKIEPSLITRADIKRWELVEITKTEDPDPHDPGSFQGSLYDPQMGRSSFNRHCSRCDDPNCAGHLGYIDLGFNPQQYQGIYVDPFLNPAAGFLVRGIMNITCPCGVPAFTNKELERWRLSRTPLERRVKAIEEHLKSQRDKGKLVCLSKSEPEHYHLLHGSLVKETTTCDAPIVTVKYDKKKNVITRESDSGPPEAISTTEIKTRFQRINSKNARLLGFKKNKPEDLLMSFVIVIPPSLRETTLVGTEEKRIDTLANEYRQIIKNKAKLNEQRQNPHSTKDELDSIVTEIHNHIARTFSAKMGKSGPQRGIGQEAKGIKEIIAGKEGDIRHIAMGKRVDRSIRAPISPNPVLRFGYCTLPRINMEGQFTDIHITSWNLKIVQKMLDEGQLHAYAPRKDYYLRRRYVISQRKNKEKLRLYPGDTVSRPLKENDDLILGRNPTIHAKGLMKVRISESKYRSENSITFPSPYTTPYNADHDGDEMHGSFPQELMSLAEGRFLSDVVRSIMNSESASACMGLVMDGIIALYTMTSPEENGYYEVSEEEYKHILSLFTWSRDLNTLDKRLKKHGINTDSSRGVISACFPATYNLEVKGKDESPIKIRDGILISGSLTKGNVGPARNSIVQELYHYYSPFRAAYLLTDLFRVANHFLSVIHGFTVGAKDIAEHDPKIPALAIPNLKRIYDVIYAIDKISPDPLETQRTESEILEHIRKGSGLDLQITKAGLSGANSFGNMARSGAKGDLFHLRQMTARGAGMGQQLFLNARLPREMTDFSRCDPYSLRYDTDPGARGYVKETLTEGLSVRSTLAHHKATRATLIDTTTKTAEAGETHHLENKSLIDFVVHYDGTLRDANGGIVQFVAGYIGLEPMHMVRVKKGKKEVEFYVDIQRLFDEAVSAVEFGLDEDEAYLLSKPIPMTQTKQ